MKGFALRIARVTTRIPSILYLVIAIVVLFSVISPVFFSISNFDNLIQQSAVLIVVSLGMAVVIIGGGIDISVGAMLGFVGSVLTVLLRAGLCLAFSILLSLVACMIIGLSSGLIISKGRIFPFIVTFGMLFMVQSVSLGITQGGSIHIPDKSFVEFGNNNYGGAPAALWVMIVLITVISVVLRRTRFGSHMYAIGVNAENARALGIRVDMLTVAAYILCAFLTGIAGIFLAARVATGNALVGLGTEFMAIAAVVVGGTPITGGRGSIAGTVLGALFISILQNGLTLMWLPSQVVAVLVGIGVMAAVVGAQLLSRGGVREQHE